MREGRNKGGAVAQAVADMQPSTSQPAPEKKLWGGRFTGDTDPLMVQFNESLPVDKRMWREDIQVGRARLRLFMHAAWQPPGPQAWMGASCRHAAADHPRSRCAAGDAPFLPAQAGADGLCVQQGSQAYAAALANAGVITQQEADEISRGLQQVASEWQQGSFQVKAGDEDIHTANERRLTEVVGAVGGKLHTGRSRNDQVQAAPAAGWELWHASAAAGPAGWCAAKQSLHKQTGWRRQGCALRVRRDSRPACV